MKLKDFLDKNNVDYKNHHGIAAIAPFLSQYVFGYILYSPYAKNTFISDVYLKIQNKFVLFICDIFSDAIDFIRTERARADPDSFTAKSWYSHALKKWLVVERLTQ